MPSETKFGMSFAKDVSPDTSGSLVHEVESDLRVTRLTLRFYGSETLLNLNPIVKTRNGSEVRLVQTIGQRDIDGHKEKMEWEIDEPVNEGDEIIVEFENTDTDYSHDFRVNMNVENSDSGGSIFV